jgi:plastocyanin
MLAFGELDAEMRLVLLLCAASLALIVSGASAVAKTVTVSITKNGYVPKSVSVAPEDTVTFTNGDTVAHQLSFKSSTGFTCTPNPLVLQPAASGSCVFHAAGSYSYSDPNTKGNTFRGSVAVTAPPDSLTMSAKPLLLIFGGKVAGAGTVSTAKTGESVDVIGQQCGAPTPQKLATVQTIAGGAYTFAVQPLMNTVYTTKLRNATSTASTVRVRPLMKLTRVAAHRYSLRVSAGESFAGKYVSLQRYNGTTKRWVAVKVIPLKASKAGVAPAVVAVASFRSTVKTGLRIRTTMAQAQVGTCYAAGLSNTIRA